MTRCQYSFIFYLTLLIIFNSSFVKGQFTWKTITEAGVYNSSNINTSDQNDLLIRLDGQLNYKYMKNENNLFFKLRIRPEFFGIENDFNALKIKGSARFARNEGEFGWGVNLTNQYQKFGIMSRTLSYDIFTLSGNISSILFDTPFNARMGYAYQKISWDEDKNLDLLFFDGFFQYLFSRYFKLGYGLYFEKFSLKSKLNLLQQKQDLKNSGMRAGAQVSLNYLKNFIFTAEYRFLIHDSELTSYPSYEQWLRLLAGKIIFTRWSVFLLIDYYSRTFKINEESDESGDLLYSPLNNENQVYLKFGYELKQNFELYLKSGYFNENLFYSDYSIEGWNVLFGFEIRG